MMTKLEFLRDAQSVSSDYNHTWQQVKLDKIKDWEEIKIPKFVNQSSIFSTALGLK